MILQIVFNILFIILANLRAKMKAEMTQLRDKTKNTVSYIRQFLQVNRLETFKSEQNHEIQIPQLIASLLLT